MALKVEIGRPADCQGRLEKEIRTYDLLDQLGISYERIDHQAVAACPLPPNPSWRSSWI